MTSSVSIDVLPGLPEVVEGDCVGALILRALDDAEIADQAVDALSQSWERMYAYAYPPISLIQRVIMK